MRAQFRSAMRRDAENVRILARPFFTTIRRKCRQYRQRQTLALLRHLRSNHKCFWQKLTLVGGALPATLANHSAWEAFHQGLCAPPTVNLQPPSVQHPCTIPSSAALDAYINEREVELALAKLSNGKAVGGAGWPVELLRYVAHYVTMEDGSRHKVWVLAPLLARLLNRCFRAGVLQPCISSALVTPIHKKGCTLDAANCWPHSCGRALLPAVHHHSQQKAGGVV